jgi:L-aminopeptidase/D-esterase-like protein
MMHIVDPRWGAGLQRPTRHTGDAGIHHHVFMVPSVLVMICAIGIGRSGMAQESDSSRVTLTSVPGVRVGHWTLTERPTGCTVVLVEAGAVGAVDVRGAAPATKETDLLLPENSVQQVHAVVLAGGSAFGLDAATGVQRYLEEHGVGFKFGSAYVPIVPAAALFDLSVGGEPSVRPNADCGYQAAVHASAAPVPEGNVGAGTGATVGKMFGMARAMKSGIGSAGIELPNGLIVAALAAVNGVGDVRDPRTGVIIAGARTADGSGFADQRAQIRAGNVRRGSGSEAGENTTLAVVATNATLTQAQARRVAIAAHDGLARAISPVHTPVDGDLVFVVAVGALDGEPDLFAIGALAADVVADAIVRAVRTARGLPGLPSVSDLAAR